MRWMSGRTGLIAAQMALADLALMVVDFTPPANGRMLPVLLKGDLVDRGNILGAGAVTLIAVLLPRSAMLLERWAPAAPRPRFAPASMEGTWSDE